MKWMCKKCKDIKESKPIRWQMDVCKCGSSGVDLENDYSRMFGEVEVINDKK